MPVYMRHAIPVWHKAVDREQLKQNTLNTYFTKIEDMFDYIFIMTIFELRADFPGYICV